MLSTKFHTKKWSRNSSRKTQPTDENTLCSVLRSTPIWPSDVSFGSTWCEGGRASSNQGLGIPKSTSDITTKEQITADTTRNNTTMKTLLSIGRSQKFFSYFVLLLSSMLSPRAVGASSLWMSTGTSSKAARTAGSSVAVIVEDAFVLFRANRAIESAPAGLDCIDSPFYSSTEY